MWPPVSDPPRKLDVFKGKKIMFSADLEMGQHLHDTIEEMVRHGGGEITDDIDHADTYICNWREGQDYIKASQQGKDVGNMTWLYYLLTHNIWTSPMRRLLHYPMPKGGIPGFKDFKISLSNYTGDARVYLENLVRATSADFTKTMKSDNTHLITAHLVSEKCDAAKDWGINLVNHLWLEESYAKCKLQPLTNPRYTHFPPRTNLSEVIGQTQLDRDAVERLYFPPGSLQPGRSSDAAPKTNGAVSSGTAVPASSEVSAPAATAAAGAETHGDAADRPTPLASRAKRARGDSNVQTPAALRKLEGKENETPSTTGSRSAKDRALSKLHDAAADVRLYEKERKRVGGVVYGGRRNSGSPAADDNGSTKEDAASRKREREAEQEEEDDGEDSVAEQAPRKAKKARGAKHAPPVQYHLMLSGDDRWVDKSTKESADRVSTSHLPCRILRPLSG